MLECGAPAGSLQGSHRFKGRNKGHPAKKQAANSATGAAYGIIAGKGEDPHSAAASAAMGQDKQ